MICVHVLVLMSGGECMHVLCVCEGEKKASRKWSSLPTMASGHQHQSTMLGNKCFPPIELSPQSPNMYILKI